MRIHGLNAACAHLALSLTALSTTPRATVSALPADTPTPAATSQHIRTLPVRARHSYHVNAAVRPVPLPFLWIGRDRVGAAEFVVRRGSGDDRAYEFAAGSDPERAPHRINRWGYMAEETNAGVTHVVGVIKQSDEKSLADIERSLDREAAGGRYPFKVYAGDISARSARAGDTVLLFDRDATYRDLERVLQALPTEPPAHLKTTLLRPGTGPGFLQAVMSVIHARVEAWRTRRTIDGGRSIVPCFFNNQVYRLTERSVSFIPSIEIGGRTYTNLLRSDFEGTQPGTSNRMPFEIVYATGGELAETPLRVLVQPRWWFQFELIFDPPRAGRAL